MIINVSYILGRELNGIHYAMSFLQGWQEQQNAGVEQNMAELKKLAAGKKVLVVGGGDTGVDCIGTSLRQVNALLSFKSLSYI